MGIVLDPQKILFLFVVTTLVFSLKEADNDSYKVVCYWASWSAYRGADGKFNMDHVDPFFCSHLIYAFAELDRDNKISAYDPNLDLEGNRGMGMYKKFTALKQQNEHLKVLLSIGGWKEGSAKYSAMAKSANSRYTFIQSCVSFLQKYGFDGLDLAWLYPANSGGAPEDKNNFVLLLQEMRRTFDSKGLIISVAASSGRKIVDSGYDVPEISRHVDFINVMTYDYHGDWETKTGHSTPLHPRPNEDPSDKILNIDSSIQYWISKGAPKKKLIMGLAFYGRTHNLRLPQVNSLGSPTEGKGIAGPITQQAGVLGFNEICMRLSKETGWNVVFDIHHQAPYTFKGKQWISYDDVQSISLKMDYVKEMKLGGAMVWSIDTDDFRGNCFGFPYPLLSVVQEDLNGPMKHRPEQPDIGTTPEIRTVSPTPSPSLLTTTERDKTELKCTREGYFRHPIDCKKFYYCQPYRDGFSVVKYNCGPGTRFDERLAACGFTCYPPDNA